MLTEIDGKSHSYLLGRAEADIDHLRGVLAELVAVTRDDLQKLPDGYRARRAIDRAISALTSGDSGK
jgi:hypothetical protein